MDSIEREMLGSSSSSSVVERDPPQSQSHFTSASPQTLRLHDGDDVHELMYQLDLTDGLPVVPPTACRVNAMLCGTDRDPKEIIGKVDFLSCL